MEKCEIELSDEFGNKLESDGAQKLGKHLGKLLLILELAGIPITKSRNANTLGKLLDLFLKLCFPIFLHISLIYLLCDTLIAGGLNYGTVIDTVLPILPCVMWIIMRMKTASMKLFFAELSKITSVNFFSSNRRLLYSTNAGICFIIVYPLLLFTVRAIQGNVINVKEVFRILQETIFPCTMVILYISICYLLLQKLRVCKKMFHKRLELESSSDGEHVMKDYFDVMKSVESFENLLNNVVFVLVLQDFCIVSILVFDMILMKEFLEKVLYEALCEILYVFGSLAIMSVSAGNIAIEMASIKSVLLENLFTHVDQDNSANKKQSLLLKKDIPSFTAGKALIFDRGFVLKALVFIFAEVVLISEIHFLLKY